MSLIFIEIKKIDDQMTSLNTFMDRVEKANDTLTEKLKALLEQQKAERQERKASLAQVRCFKFTSSVICLKFSPRLAASGRVAPESVRLPFTSSKYSQSGQTGASDPPTSDR